MNIVYEVVENFGVVPVIECLEHKDLIKLHDFLKDNVFNEGKKRGCYYTNRKHLIVFNGKLIVAWINSKGFTHIIMEDRHYRIDLKKNDMVIADNYYYNFKSIVKNDCVNYKNLNIYEAC